MDSQDSEESHEEEQDSTDSIGTERHVQYVIKGIIYFVMFIAWSARSLYPGPIAIKNAISVAICLGLYILTTKIGPQNKPKKTNKYLPIVAILVILCLMVFIFRPHLFIAKSPHDLQQNQERSVDSENDSLAGK